MTATAKAILPSLVPLLRYRDVAAAIDWLHAAFGFERHSVVTSESGAIIYAQLASGNAMVMLESAPAGFTPLASDPTSAGGQSCYIVIDAPDAHYARARAAGAEIVLDIQDFDQGRGYSCRDGDGHVWSFGTFNPWQGDSATAAEPEPQPEPQPAPLSAGRPSARWAALSGLLATVVTSAVAAAWISGADPQGAREDRAPLSAPSISADELAREKTARQTAERAVQEAEVRASLEKSAWDETARKSAQEAASLLEQERTARAVAEHAAEQTRAELDREMSAKAAAERTAAELQAQLREKTTAARAVAVEAVALVSPDSTAMDNRIPESEQRKTAELREQLAKERSAREAAERAIEEAKQDLERERIAGESARRDAAELKDQLVKQQRASQEVSEQINRERAGKDQAWRTVGQLKKQLARVQAGGEANQSAPAPAIEEPSGSSKGTAATKKSVDPQYNGPLSPF